MAEGGPYSPFIGYSIAQVIAVEVDQIYIFAMYNDEFGSGMCCWYGFSETYVYLGSQVPSTKTENVLAYIDGRFEDESCDTFVASPDASTIEFSMAP
jgi:hypothetical protein